MIIYQTTLLSIISPGNNLIGGAITILQNMKVNAKDYPIYYGK